MHGVGWEDDGSVSSIVCDLLQLKEDIRSQFQWQDYYGRIDGNYHKAAF